MMQVSHHKLITSILSSSKPCLLIFILIVFLHLAYSTSAIAEENDNATDAVTSLKAYAQFKSGNYEAARIIWQKLADKGNTTALINLANLFQQGIGVEHNQLQALEYIQQASKLGDARAQYELGLEYEKGILLERDINMAATLLHQSAQQDNMDGQYAYAILLATNYGKGLPTTSPAQREEALMWLNKSRENGHPDAGSYIQLLMDPDKLAPLLPR